MRPLLLASFLTASSTMIACASGTISPSLTYVSDLAVPKSPLSVDVKVSIAPGTVPAALQDNADQIASSFSTSIREDLTKNGPFAVGAGDATLEIELSFLKEYHDYGVAAPGFGYSILYSSVPPMLGWLIWPAFGSPTARHQLAMRAAARVKSPGGKLLAETQSSSECIEWSNIYTKDGELTFACAARILMETMRTKLASKSSEILAARAVADVETKLSAADHPSWVVAVMNVEETSRGAVEHELARGLVDQIRIYVAQRGVRTVDRTSQDDVAKKQIVAMKEASYDACFDQACQIELGKALAATHILRSRIARFGARCVLNAELIELRAETTVAASSSQGTCEPEGLLRMSEEVAKALTARSTSES